MTAKDDVDALLAQAELLRSKLLAERQALLAKVEEIDAQLGRLPGAAEHPAPVSLDVWRARRRTVLATEIGRVGQEINGKDILHAVAMYYGLAVTQLQGPERFPSITRGRHVAMYLAKKLTTESYPELGMLFGNRDHTTVVGAVKKIEEKRSVDPELNREVDSLETVIREAQALRAQPPPPPPPGEAT
jgi:chromosomal replication initiator protein